LSAFAAVSSLLFLTAAGAYSSPSQENFFYRFNDTAGPLQDFSGNNRDASIVGSPNFGATGVDSNTFSELETGNWGDGKSINLSGSDAATSSYSNSDDQFTFSTWIKPTDLNQLSRVLIGENSGNFAVQIQTRSGACSDTCYATAFKDESGSFHPAVFDVNTLYNNWTMVTGSYDGNNLELYVNANQKASNSVSAQVSDLTALNIGQGPSGGNKFKGGIDETHIFDTALNQTEIENLYRYNDINGSSSGDSGSGEGGSDSNTTSNITAIDKIIRYDLNNSGSSVPDYSGNNFDASISGSFSRQVTGAPNTPGDDLATDLNGGQIDRSDDSAYS
jgi:hypothetical protein